MRSFRVIAVWSTIGFVGVILVAAIWGVVQSQRETDEQRLAMVLMSRGVQERLGGVFGPGVENVVVRRMSFDAGADGSIEFRAAVRQTGEQKPVYGVATPLCEELERQVEATCWRFQVLMLAGEALDVGGGDAGAPPPSEDELEQSSPAPLDTPPSDSPPQQIVVETVLEPVTSPEAASRETESEEGVVPPSPAPGAGGSTGLGEEEESQASLNVSGANVESNEVAEVAPPVSPPSPTHRISGSEVNLRDGPGQEFEAIRLVRRGLLLALRETQGEWGRFLVLDGPEEGREVWVFLPLTEAL